MIGATSVARASRSNQRAERCINCGDVDRPRWTKRVRRTDINHTRQLQRDLVNSATNIRHNSMSSVFDATNAHNEEK